jgi:hypothetical protein
MTPPSQSERGPFAVGDRVQLAGAAVGTIIKPAHRDSPWEWVVESEDRRPSGDPRWTVAVRREEIKRV